VECAISGRCWWEGKQAPLARAKQAASEFSTRAGCGRRPNSAAIVLIAARVRLECRAVRAPRLLDKQPWAKAKVRERPSASHSPPMLPSPHVPEIAARARASCFPRLRAGSTQLGANLLCRPGQKRARGPDRSPTSVYAPLYAGQMAKFDLASALTRKECVPSACARSA